MSGNGWHIVRVTIEALSPMSCGSGGQGVVDAQLVRDANGLPMIPGATIQGQLNQLCARIHGDSEAKKLFGAPLPNGRTQDGLVICGHGCVHDSNNVAVSGLRYPLSDALLEALVVEAPLRRDHVRLTHRHSAANGGKFDRAAVPVGTRFSFELAMAGTADRAPDLTRLAQLCHHPLFRPGAGRARGYGRVRVAHISHQFFGPTDAAKLRTARDAAPSKPLTQPVPAPTAFTDMLEITLTLSPLNPWRIGSTGVARDAQSHARVENRNGAMPDPRAKPANLVPTREPKISWVNRRATLARPDAGTGEGYVAPGSGIRGPLAHRMLFHWNRGKGHFIKADLATSSDDLENWSHRPPELATLLGEVKGANGSDIGSGRASRITVEDVALLKGNGPPDIFAMDHNSIDRFTGGTRRGALFSEEVTVTGDIAVQLFVDANGQEHDAEVAQALCHALRDLAEGRLALGAKSYGYFAGGPPQFNGPTATQWEAAWKATERSGRSA